MTAIKSADADRFVARPDPGQPIVLVFGPDAGLVRERVDALVKASVDDVSDPFAFVRIEGEELTANPSRLVEEAQHHSAVRRPPRRAGESRRPQHFRRARTGAGLARRPIAASSSRPAI